MMIKPLLIASLLVAATAPQLSFAAGPYGNDLVLAQNGYNDYRDDRYDSNRPPPPPAGGPAVFSDQARVVRVQPRIEQVTMPQEECRNEVETVQNPNSGNRGIGGALIGGIAGGILGNQVGGGNGRTAATAIGAIGGALAGENVANNTAPPQGYSQREVRRCHTVNRVVERNNGYDVTYQYQGRNYNTVMANSPGNMIRVNVSVTPAY